MKSAALLLLSACALMAVVCAGADTPPAPPKPEVLLDKFIEVSGGKEAHAKIKTEIMDGSLEMPAQGIKGKLTIFRSEPNRTFTEVEIEGVGKIEQVTDGVHAWELSVIGGARVKDGEELESTLRAANMASTLEWRKFYPKVEPAGTETVFDKPCYAVKLTPATGKPETRCYDAASGLLVKSSMIVKTPMGEIPAESTFADYRDEGGVQVPHKMTQKVMGAEIVMTVNKVTVNPPIPDDKFAMPAEVKALLDKAAVKPAEAPKPAAPARQL
jgi:zinc protease